jgi:small subunit ribosomal protein S21
MLIIERKDGESIDRVLKRYKRKHRRTKIRQELRRRKQFTKPSVKRRTEIIDAIYREQKKNEDEQ